MGPIRASWAAILLGSVCFWGCGGGNAKGLSATLTLKDGSHFSGTVLRRDPNSITVEDAAHETRTFLYSELAGAIKYVTPQGRSGISEPTAPPVPTDVSGPGPSSSTGLQPIGTIIFPVGTEFQVVTDGYLDSCCLPVGAFSVGFVDADVHVGGKVALPKGASVTIMFMEKTMVDGRVVMKFELGSADFGGRHYIISAAKGGLEPGAVAAFTGAKEGTPEAKARGLEVHLDDHSLMVFKAATPTILRLSQ